MKLIEIKTGLSIIIMIAFLLMAFVTHDEINRQLFASLGIISGALTSKHTLPKSL